MLLAMYTVISTMFVHASPDSNQWLLIALDNLDVELSAIVDAAEGTFSEGRYTTPIV